MWRGASLSVRLRVGPRQLSDVTISWTSPAVAADTAPRPALVVAPPQKTYAPSYKVIEYIDRNNRWCMRMAVSTKSQLQFTLGQGLDPHDLPKAQIWELVARCQEVPDPGLCQLQIPKFNKTPRIELRPQLLEALDDRGFVTFPVCQEVDHSGGLVVQVILAVEVLQVVVRDAIVNHVWRVEGHMLVEIPQELLCQVCAPNVRHSTVNSHGQQQPPETFVQVHSGLRVVRRENVRGQGQHLWCS
mmetsp:Transcript_14906/g.41057  ORF Transcript_14906/g.41057 Transcript_14906/m.41057 type:complete len:244 (-) Transcript_14906:850-1581(-)